MFEQQYFSAEHVAYLLPQPRIHCRPFKIVWFERDRCVQRRDFADRHRAELFLGQWRTPRSPCLVIHELCRIDPHLGVVINLIIYAEPPAIWAAGAPNSEGARPGWASLRKPMGHNPAAPPSLPAVARARMFPAQFSRRHRRRGDCLGGKYLEVSE